MGELYDRTLNVDAYRKMQLHLSDFCLRLGGRPVDKMDLPEAFDFCGCPKIIIKNCFSRGSILFHSPG